MVDLDKNLDNLINFHRHYMILTTLFIAKIGKWHYSIGERRRAEKILIDFEMNSQVQKN